jgi:hypothetical protein
MEHINVPTARLDTTYSQLGGVAQTSLPIVAIQHELQSKIMRVSDAESDLEI